ncbi:MAG: long-chain-acyl-CoA synthetase [Promethearchaeota archaeon]
MVRVKLTKRELEAYAVYGDEIRGMFQNPHRSIGIHVEKNVNLIPNKIALYYEEKSWTWQNFNEESNKYSNYFLEMGLKKSEVVALLLENSPEYLFATTGINKIQGISALINFHLKKKPLIHSINMVNPKFLIVDGDSLQSLKDVAAQLDIPDDHILVINNSTKLKHDFKDLPIILQNISTRNPDTTNNSIVDDIALYIYTSGTTGLPKAVIMKNFKLHQNGCFIPIAGVQLIPEDIIYIPTPLYHSVGFSISWCAATFLGATIVVRKNFSASEFWKDIQKYKITYMTYVGEIPRYLLNQPVSELEKNHTLKRIAGLGLRKEIWDDFKTRFQIDQIFEFYASTEGHKGFMNLHNVPGMVGRLTMKGFELAKYNTETGEFYKDEKGYCIQCDIGDTGMGLMVISPGSGFEGYKDQEKTENKILQNAFKRGDKYFITGDIFKLHDDYYISFADRLGDTFRWKSENVSTLEVEDILNSYPAIERSAVYGVLIPNTEGRAGMAAINLNPSMKFDLKDLSHFVNEVLPSYAIPVFIRIKEEKLETTGTFKIKKVKLRDDAYNVNIISDPMYIWAPSNKKYITLNKAIYKSIMDGNFDKRKMEKTELI